MGAPVWPDVVPDYAGPLAGWLTGLEHCATPFMMTVPCDTPNFPVDLVERLAVALTQGGAEIAMAATRENDETHRQPVFCLIKAALRETLAAFLNAGNRKIAAYTGQHRCVEVVFDDARAFFNVNTSADLQQLQTGAR